MFEDYTLPAGAPLLLALLGGLPEKSILFGGPRKTPMSPWKSRLFARGGGGPCGFPFQKG